MNKDDSGKIRSTTVLAVMKDGKGVMAADGQVTLGETIMKHKATKIRRMYKESVLVGFAGAAADAINLLERLEGKLESYKGNLLRAAVELAKDWRTDKILRKLEALILAMDKEHILVISGTGDVIEPDQPVAAIGSGGPFAQAAAQALVAHSNLDPTTIALEAMKIAASICVYTNDQITIYELDD
ncbi:MAG: ATP-dependent protease subunit HslV [Proteobacteria bacterium]|jgi:ATP-dependent HslUV protease subunit HslV|nr:ATP-dependent protease subunit HslV [Desulfobacterales bacterium]MBL7101748.1 ATP-dependent protease subunit HslV [Desulfobacteraceae bacterium]MBL7172625.1 ATP-dependent protease subunit HslV [Desulfobacteraceae bacterium]MBU0732659.1 ATP-dependent protease subunit HslV [Pseudomonadota bacterium]MBU1902492.1 ATP-dependent protease subunit HslV [Pseudomonadota bacterium]